MKKNTVGRIKNITINEETKQLEITLLVTDPKFKKKLLRDLSLSGHLTVESDQVVFHPEQEEVE